MNNDLHVDFQVEHPEQRDPSTLVQIKLGELLALRAETKRLRHELNETGAILAISRKGVRDLSDDLAAALKRAEISEKALHEISTAFNSHWTDVLHVQRIAKEALAAIAGVAKGGEG